MAPAESSSTTGTPVVASTAASSAARDVVSEIPVGFCARGWRKTAAVGEAMAADRAPGSGPSSSIGTPTTSAPTDSSRSSSGGKQGCSTTTRSPNRTIERATRSSASIAPSTTVSSSASYGQSARSRRISSGSTGSSR